VALVACSPPAKKVEAQGLLIVHTNDLEGAFDPCSCITDPAGGASRRATALRQLRAEHPSLLIVDAGDALFGTPVSDATYGEGQVAVMNALGYDAAALGDRDFRYGLDVLLKAIRQAKFPFLSANVVWADSGAPITQASTLVQVGNLKVAVLGLTSPSVQGLVKADPTMSQKLRLLNPVETAKRLVPDLARHADAVIVLSHLGSARDKELARDVSGITAIIGGHDRKMVSPPEMLERGVPRAEMGYQGDYLGVLNVKVGEGGRSVGADAADIQLTSSIKSDPAMTSLLTHYKAVAVLSGQAPIATALTVSLPLSVHRADERVQRAYVIAAAFPEALLSQPPPGDISGAKSLLDCFVASSSPDYQIEYAERGVQAPSCVSQTLGLLPTLAIPRPPVPVDPDYRPAE
jgi:2',3'-cyclic-nucleotide 2'-phosphodiesterase (5'-nucleotidase family)